jgi:thioredoxin 1
MHVSPIQELLMPAPYLSETEAPSRADVEALRGLTVLEFGTDWCGHCRAAQGLVAEALAQQPQWQHLKVEDGSGRALGRSYRVKLWPTFLVLRDGVEVARVVRPTQADELLDALRTA